MSSQPSLCQQAKIQAKIVLDNADYWFCKPCALQIQSLPPKYRKAPGGSSAPPPKPSKRLSKQLLATAAGLTTAAPNDSATLSRGDGKSEAARAALPSARALYDWKAQKATEISFKKGEVIFQVRQMDGEWWRGATKEGARGYFPKAYVELLGSAAQKVNDNQVYTTEKPPLARAMFAFKAASDKELSFAAGDVLGELERVSQDWWRGVLRGKKGFFPSDYVTPLEKAWIPKCPYDAVAKFDYWGKDSNQLTFRAGEDVLVIERSATTKGWWAGRARDRIGYFPANFCRALTADEKRQREAAAAAGNTGDDFWSTSGGGGGGGGGGGANPPAYSQIPAQPAAGGAINYTQLPGGGTATGAQLAPLTDEESMAKRMQSLLAEESNNTTTNPAVAAAAALSDDSDDSSDDDGAMSYSRMLKQQFKAELQGLEVPAEAPSAPVVSNYHQIPSQ